MEVEGHAVLLGEGEGRLGIDILGEGELAVRVPWPGDEKGCPEGRDPARSGRDEQDGPRLEPAPAHCDKRDSSKTGG